MTAPDMPPAPSSTRSRRVIAVIVVVVLIALVVGVFIVDEVTDDGGSDAPADVAAAVVAAVKAGDDGALRDRSTGAGTTQLLAIKPADADGLTAASCTTLTAATPTRVCIATRPGGQLQLRLVRTDGEWKVDGATIGPAGLPPTSSTTATT